MTAPAEALVNALAMMCPFEPAEKQALLEAPSFQNAPRPFVALLEMARRGRPHDDELRRYDGNRSQAAGNSGLPPDQDVLRYDRERQELVSRAAGLAYPIRGGVPVMLPGEARELSEEERDALR